MTAAPVLVMSKLSSHPRLSSTIKGETAAAKDNLNNGLYNTTFYVTGLQNLHQPKTRRDSLENWVVNLTSQSLF